MNVQDEEEEEEAPCNRSTEAMIMAPTSSSIATKSEEKEVLARRKRDK
jgi:hypothetical protein